MGINLETIYQTDGKGQWWKREIKEKCEELIFIRYACQREKGHDGEHWSYMESGSYVSSLKGGGCCILPPDSAEYISPLDSRNEYYLSKSSDWIEVLDKEEISRIEQDEKEDQISVDRPFEFERKENV